MQPLHKRLTTKLLLLFGLLVGFIIANSIYSNWQWNRSASQKLSEELTNKLLLSSSIILNELDKFKQISLVIHERNLKFIEFIEYDNYRAVNVMLQNIASMYDVDFLALYDEDNILSTNEQLFERSRPLPAALKNLDEHSDITVFPVSVFPGLSARLAAAQPNLPVPEQVVCFKAEIKLYHDSGDLAGRVMMFKFLNQNQNLALKISALSGANLVLYDVDRHTLMSSFGLAQVPYPDSDRLSLGTQEYFVKHDVWVEPKGTVVAHLVVAIDSQPFRKQRSALLLNNLLPFLITLGISAALIFLLKFRIFNQITRLNQVLERVAGGDLHARLPLPGHSSRDEMDYMGRNFNRMMEQLEDSYIELDINRQTLEDVNRQLITEVRERKNAETALREAKREADAANQAKSLFLAGMSHEIRTPMNAILGYAQILLRNGELSPSQLRALEIIQRSGNHLLGLINDILDISKIEAGRMELRPVDFNLSELVRDLCALFRLRSEEKGLAWHLHYFSDPPPAVYVCGDAGKLRQVLINLLGNAVKFTDQGSVSLSVVPLGDDRYYFEVKDTGAGIGEAAQKTIFDPFQQDEQGQKKGGTGLGLSIASRQVKLMGGELEVASELGKATRFFFSLPLPPAEREASGEGALALHRVKHLAADCEVDALVVDDDPVNREVLTQTLQGIGVTVREAGNGREAMELLRQRAAHIVFLDYHMPEMDGISTLQAIGEEFGTRVKTVMISASAFEQDHQRFRQAGCPHLISKPFQIEHIYACLHEQLGARYEYQSPPPVGDGQAGEATPKLSALAIPADLLGRLREAAEFCVITDMQKALDELTLLGEPQARLAQALKRLTETYDMDAILEILTQE